MTTVEEAIRIDVFWEALKDYGIEPITEAFEHAFKTLKWFPRPAEIIEIIVQQANKQYLIMTPADQLEWKRISIEKGREFLQTLFAKLDAEDKRVAEEREKVFEEKRAVLKRQAKIIAGQKGGGVK